MAAARRSSPCCPTARSDLALQPLQDGGHGPNLSSAELSTHQLVMLLTPFGPSCPLVVTELVVGPPGLLLLNPAGGLTPASGACPASPHLQQPHPLCSTRRSHSATASRPASSMGS
ncbi:poly [Platysternon megacephalum]|uniref:Poly n=1 Tax=Platysternon megacephalum TaxID=55544 RepID=A0A4D9DXK5_9SAUR|nr:poly [Platysternon megacephalum]